MQQFSYCDIHVSETDKVASNSIDAVTHMSHRMTRLPVKVQLLWLRCVRYWQGGQQQSSYSETHVSETDKVVRNSQATVTHMCQRLTRLPATVSLLSHTCVSDWQGSQQQSSYCYTHVSETDNVASNNLATVTHMCQRLTRWPASNSIATVCLKPSMFTSIDLHLNF